MLYFGAKMSRRINHRIIEWCWLEGTSKIILFEHPLHWQGCHSLNEAPAHRLPRATSNMAFEHLQRLGIQIRSLSAQKQGDI